MTYLCMWVSELRSGPALHSRRVLTQLAHERESREKRAREDRERKGSSSLTPRSLGRSPVKKKPTPGGAYCNIPCPVIQRVKCDHLLCLSNFTCHSFDIGPINRQDSEKATFEMQMKLAMRLSAAEAEVDAARKAALGVATFEPHTPSRYREKQVPPVVHGSQCRPPAVANAPALVASSTSTPNAHGCSTRFPNPTGDISWSALAPCAIHLLSWPM